MNIFEIEKVESDMALAFWLTAPHGSAFTHPEVLQTLSAKVDWWRVRKGEKAMCLWPVCRDKGGSVYLPPFTYWVGPMFSQAALDTPPHRIFAYTQGVIELLLAKLTEIYSPLKASLPKRFTDVRAFDWWNYHATDKGRFRISPRYTAVLEHIQTRSMESITASFREVRRQELRKGLSQQEITTSDMAEVDEIAELYSALLNRQGETNTAHHREEIAKLVSLVSRGFGYLTVLRSANGQLEFVALVLDAKGCANLVLNAVNLSSRNLGIAARGVATTIEKAKNRGNDTFDFNGANSPKRGDDKHSYGATTELYFEVSNQ